MRWLSIVIVVGQIAVAHAQNPDAKRALQAGIDAFRLGKYIEAREHLVNARSLDRTIGDTHRYLAAVAQAESKWEECITFARDALLVEPTAKSAGETRKLHAACRASAGRPAFAGALGDGAAIAVTSNVPATVKVRGLVFGGTPIAPRSVTAGRLAIDVEKAGYVTMHIDVDVLPGIVTDVDVKLEAGEDVVAVPLARKTGSIKLPANVAFDVVIDGAPTKVSSDHKIELSPGIHVVELRTAGKDPWRRRVAIVADGTRVLAPDLVDSGPRESRRRLGLGLAGGGIGLAVLGVFAFYKSSGASEDARAILAQEIARPIGDTSTPFRTRDEFEDARTRANRWGTISNVAYFAGLVAGGFGGYFILKGRAPAEDDVPAFVLAPIPNGAMIARSASW